MKIQVRLHGALGRYRPAGASLSHPFELDVADGATVESVVARLGIPKGAARGLFVNERPSEPEDALAPGDQLMLFPLVAGG